MEWIIVGVMTVSYLFLSYFLWKKAYKKGAKDLFQLFMVDFYQQKVNAFKIQNKHVKKGGIAFIGDSITQDYPLQDFFSDLVTYNRGIGGDTTLGLSHRLNESAFEMNPQIIVMLIGTNDLSLTLDNVSTIIDRICHIIETILSKLPQVDIVLQSIYPVNPKLNLASVGPRKNQDIQKINQALQKIKSIHYVDINQSLQNEEGLLDSSFSYDGLHLSANGYEKVTSILKPLLNNLLKKD